MKVQKQLLMSKHVGSPCKFCYTILILPAVSIQIDGYFGFPQI